MRARFSTPSGADGANGNQSSQLCLAFGRHPIARSIRECMQELTLIVLNGLSRALPFSDSTERVGLAGSHSLALEELRLLLHELLLLLDIEGAEKNSASLFAIQMAVNEPTPCDASNASSVDGLIEPALWPALALSGLLCPPTSPRTAVASVAARPSTIRSASSSTSVRPTSVHRDPMSSTARVRPDKWPACYACWPYLPHARRHWLTCSAPSFGGRRRDRAQFRATRSYMRALEVTQRLLSYTHLT